VLQPASKKKALLEVCPRQRKVKFISIQLQQLPYGSCDALRRSKAAEPTQISVAAVAAALQVDVPVEYKRWYERTASISNSGSAEEYKPMKCLWRRKKSR
jgi:hypothetical protein